MTSKEDLYSSLVYLDRDFISARFEFKTGVAPETKITKSQGKKAAAKLAVFEAGISADETRTFSVSTLGMLSDLLPELTDAIELTESEFRCGMHSRVGWIDGDLTTVKTSSTVGHRGQPNFRLINEEIYFVIRHSRTYRLALITAPEYFFSGFDAFRLMHDTILKELSLPVRALVRVVAAKSHLESWIATPYVIFERPSVSEVAR